MKKTISYQPAQLNQVERNTGVFVYTVIEDSHAFYANVLDGEINKIDIINSNHALEFMSSYVVPRKEVVFSIKI
jgi:hypothetical protein